MAVITPPSQATQGVLGQTFPTHLHPNELFRCIGIRPMMAVYNPDAGMNAQASLNPMGLANANHLR